MRSRVFSGIFVLVMVTVLAVLAVACTSGATTSAVPSTTPPATGAATTTPAAPAVTTTTEAPSAELNHTTVDELKEMMDTFKVNTDFVILDTRDSASYADSHIPGAINIPYSAAGDPFERGMMYMVLPMNKPVVIYCG